MPYRRQMPDWMPDWKIDRAKEMRQRPTKAEALLWSAVRKKQLGPRFLRQAPLLGYIADFYCHDARLVVEVDGGYRAERTETDKLRDRRLLAAGIRTLRFTNARVLDQLPLVLAEIRATMSRPARPTRNSWRRDLGLAPRGRRSPWSPDRPK